MIRFLSLFTFIILLFVPKIVLAHSPIAGIGTLFNGVLHPLLVPTQLLVILVLGLWFGQNHNAKNKQAILLYLLAVIAGLVTTHFWVLGDVSLPLLVGAATVGLLVLSRLTVPQAVYIVVAMVLGFMVGLDSAQDELNAKAKLVSLFGSGVGIYFLMLYAMALSESLSKKTWQIIVVRVMASWITASALMVLALHSAGKG